MVRFMKLSKCYKQEQHRITLSFASSSEAQALRTMTTKALVLAGCEAKFGRAPPTNQERELQSWLEELLKA